MRLYYFFGLFFSQKTQKSRGVIIVCSGFEESVCQILQEKKYWKFLKKAQNGWLCDTLESRSQPLAHHIFLLTTFRNWLGHILSMSAFIVNTFKLIVNLN